MLVYQRVTHWNGLVSPNNSPAGSEGSYIEKRNLPGHIVDGCEILHHQSRMVKTLYINGQTTYQLVQDFATIHSMYIYKIIYIYIYSNSYSYHFIYIWIKWINLTAAALEWWSVWVISIRNCGEVRWCFWGRPQENWQTMFGGFGTWCPGCPQEYICIHSNHPNHGWVSRKSMSRLISQNRHPGW